MEKEKRKRDVITPEMRERLLANREGKLTVSQWLSMTVRPLLWILLLLGAALVVFGPRLLVLGTRGLWLILPALVMVIFVPVIMRARRYARLPVHFEQLYADVPLSPWWRAPVFYDKDDQQIRFKHRLAPHMPMRIDGAYFVYFLQDGTERVLLSLAPADHEDADLFRPTERFWSRYNRRLHDRDLS
jgi:hypothetical protein